MGTERKTEFVCDCLCGQGSVEESFWSNDHAFASNYDWHSQGLELNCAACKEKWVVMASVANPVATPNNKSAIYFVTKEELKTITLHNAEVEKELAAITHEKFQLQDFLVGKIRTLQTELLSEIDKKGTRLEMRFKFLGPLVGLANVKSFRNAVGKTRPKTYIPKLVNAKNLSDVFQRMNRADEVELIRRTKGRLAQITQEEESLKTKRKLPRASEHRFSGA